VDGKNLILDVELKARYQRADTEKKTLVKKVVDSLEKGLTVLRKKECPKIKKRKEQQIA